MRDFNIVVYDRLTTTSSLNFVYVYLKNLSVFNVGIALLKCLKYFEFMIFGNY